MSQIAVEVVDLSHIAVSVVKIYQNFGRILPAWFKNFVLFLPIAYKKMALQEFPWRQNFVVFLNYNIFFFKSQASAGIVLRGYIAIIISALLSEISGAQLSTTCARIWGRSASTPLSNSRERKGALANDGLKNWA